jgi:hypothetical protein
MTYSDADTSFHALPADIRARVEARVGKPPRPMSTMQIMAAIGQEIVAERERCARYHEEKIAEIWNADHEQMSDAEKTAHGIAYSIHIHAADAMRNPAPPTGETE